MPPRRSARIAARRVVPEAISLDDADTESLAASAVCEACNEPASTRHMEHFLCRNFSSLTETMVWMQCAHSAGWTSVTSWMVALTFVVLSAKVLWTPRVQKRRPHTFSSCCPRVLFHVRCLAATISSRSPEVSCPLCPGSVRFRQFGLVHEAVPSMGFSLCRTIWVSACCVGRSWTWSPASESVVTVSHCMSLASPAVLRHGDSRARSAISPSLTSRSLRVFRRLRCFTAA